MADRINSRIAAKSQNAGGILAVALFFALGIGATAYLMMPEGTKDDVAAEDGAALGVPRDPGAYAVSAIGSDPPAGYALRYDGRTVALGSGVAGIMMGSTRLVVFPSGLEYEPASDAEFWRVMSVKPRSNKNQNNQR